MVVALAHLTFADKPASQPATSSQAASRPASTQPSGKRVVIETSHGRIVLELTPDKTPETVKNFLTYVDEKFYDGTIFHRVISGFMIQGGGYTVEASRGEGGEKKTHSPIKNESAQAMKNARGTISMARLGPNPSDPDRERARQKALDSATSQFFINHRDNAPLDSGGPYGGYTVFGKVIEGMDVVDKIASTAVQYGPLSPPNGPPSQPKEPVLIKSIRRAPD
jgi:cyclophilin family peptidyl-prolyl cis-trans isomerase